MAYLTRKTRELHDTPEYLGRFAQHLFIFILDDLFKQVMLKLYVLWFSKNCSINPYELNLPEFFFEWDEWQEKICLLLSKRLSSFFPTYFCSFRRRGCGHAPNYRKSVRITSRVWRHVNVTRNWNRTDYRERFWFWQMDWRRTTWRHIFQSSFFCGRFW